MGHCCFLKKFQYHFLKIKYEGVVHLTSKRGTDKQIEIENGIIPFVDVRDLRSGIVVMCKDETRLF